MIITEQLYALCGTPFNQSNIISLKPAFVSAPRSISYQWRPVYVRVDDNQVT